MKFKILSLFPNIFQSIFNESILKRAQTNSLIDIEYYDIRKWTNDKHRKVDDSPYGGGNGMILKADIIDKALSDLQNSSQNKNNHNANIPHIILLTPQGKIFNQKIAKSLSKKKELVLICGHYEGFDERIRQMADEEISIGKYILTGGEIPAMVIIDAVSRLIPKVLGKINSTKEESFSMENMIDKNEAKKLDINTSEFLEYPQYTRPAKFKSISLNKTLKVPKILLSGNHEKIHKWRQNQSISKTLKKNK